MTKTAHNDACPDQGNLRSGPGLNRPSVDLEQFVAEHYGRVLHFLVKFTRSGELARDFSQKTWLRVLEHGFPELSGRPHAGWLLTIARNVAIDESRRARLRCAAHPLPSRSPASPARPGSLPSAHPDSPSPRAGMRA